MQVLQNYSAWCSYNSSAANIHTWDPRLLQGACASAVPWLQPRVLSCIQGVLKEMDKEEVAAGCEMKECWGLAATSALNDSKSQAHREKSQPQRIAHISGCLMPLS